MLVVFGRGGVGALLLLRCSWWLVWREYLCTSGSVCGLVKTWKLVYFVKF